MKINPVFVGKVLGGSLKISNMTMWRGLLAELEGKEVEVILKERERIRTVAQNNLYQHYIKVISADTGHSEEYLKGIFTKEFLSEGEGTATVVKSTASLTISEFQDYLEKIKQKMASVGIVLEDPGWKN